MIFQSYKPKIGKKLLSIVLAISIALPISIITPKPITAYADPDYVGIVIDALGASGVGGSKKVKNGVTYARTGYLCYLLTADGATIPGMTAKAFYNSNYSELGGSIWVCNSKKGGYTVSSWEDEAPWGLPPFNENKSTNVGLIRQWMAQPLGNSCNAIQFVTDNWGFEIAEKFATGDYVLVLETILNFQPNVKRSGDVQTREQISSRISTEVVMHILSSRGINPSGLDLTQIRAAVIEELYNTQCLTSGYKTIGSPVIGTCSDCISYEKAVGGQPSIFASYTNKIACFAEYIMKGGPGEKAGFIPWTGTIPTLLSDSDVSTYGVAMMVIKAKNDAQTTCDEGKLPVPHNPPDESDGTKRIIKNYRTRNLTTNELTEDGNTFIIEEVSADILIEDEDEYVVVGWATSSGTTFIPSPTWESTIPSTGTLTQKGLSSGSVKLAEEDEKTLYVLLEKVESEEVEELDYNYLMTQSMITRTVWQNYPDEEGAGWEYLYDYDFTWESKGHLKKCYAIT